MLILLFTKHWQITMAPAMIRLVRLTVLVTESGSPAFPTSSLTEPITAPPMSAGGVFTSAAQSRRRLKTLFSPRLFLSLSLSFSFSLTLSLALVYTEQQQKKKKQPDQ